MNETSVTPPPRGRRWWRYAGEALLLVLLLFGVHSWQIRDLPTGPAPPLEDVLLNGDAVTLNDLRGQPVLVHFWATWCPVCKLEEGSIATLARDHHVISVAMQSGSKQEVLDHLRRNGVTFPVINDPDAVQAQRWQVRAVPTSFIIDRAGGIRFIEVGYTTEIGLRLRLWLAGQGLGGRVATTTRERPHNPPCREWYSGTVRSLPSSGPAGHLLPHAGEGGFVRPAAGFLGRR